MDKKKPTDFSGKQVNKPVPSPAQNNSDGPTKEKSATASPKPYSKSERRKNRIKLEENSIYIYDSQEGFDAEAEDMLRQPVKEYGDEEEQPLPPAKEPVSPKKRRRQRIIFYVVTVAAAVIFCTLLSMTVFFKIDEIAVEGITRYSQEEIIEASLIHKNDNLLLCSTSPGEKKIVSEIPYVENVSIRKKLFNQIVIHITEARPTSIVENKGRYYVLSQKGKIIEIDKKKLYDVPSILGAKLKNETLCAYAEYENDNIKKYIDEIMEKVAQYKLKDVETIDITSPTHIVLIRKNGFRISIGSPENIDCKFKTIMEVMEKDVPLSATGELDVSLSDTEGGKSYLKLNVPEESSTQESQQQSSQPQEPSEPKEESSGEEVDEELSEEVTEESEEESNEEYSEEENEYTEEYSDEENEYTEEYSDEESQYTEDEAYSEESGSEYYEEEYAYEDENADSESSDEYTENEDDGGDDEYTGENDTEELAE